MKNKSLLFLGVIFILFLIGIVSACPGPSCEEYTNVKGAIYNADFTDTISGANVEVICHHNGNDYSLSTMTNSNGNYSVWFNKWQCDYEDAITVSAQKSDLYGLGEGEVDETYTFSGYFWYCKTINIGIVNVPLVPEFGLIAGITTLIGALGMFFYVRKK